MCGVRVRRLSAILLLPIAVIPHSETAVSRDLRIEHVMVVSPESAQEIRSANVTTRAGRIQNISTTPGAAAP